MIPIEVIKLWFKGYDLCSEHADAMRTLKDRELGAGTLPKIQLPLFFLLFWKGQHSRVFIYIYTFIYRYIRIYLDIHAMRLVPIPIQRFIQLTFNGEDEKGAKFQPPLSF